LNQIFIIRIDFLKLEIFEEFAIIPIKERANRIRNPLMLNILISLNAITLIKELLPVANNP